MLLVIAVMFTFSFGSAFAASYTAADYASAYTAEMNNQLSYLATAKAKWVNDFTYNNEGYIKVDFSGAADADAIAGYSKAALEAGADALIQQLTTAMSLAIGKATAFTDPTETAPELAVVKDAYDLNDNATTDGDEVLVSAAVADFPSVAQASNVVKAAIEKAQAPLTKAAVEAKLNAVDLSKYDTKTKKYSAGTETVTAAEYVQYLISQANTSIATASSAATDALKRTGYETAYSTFKTAFGAVPTIEEQAVEDGETAKDVEGAVNAYLAYGIETGYATHKFAANDNLSTGALSTTFASFINATKKTVFGVSVANLAKITTAEANAINNAYYDAIKASVDVVRVYANGVDGNAAAKVAAVEALYADFTKFLTTLSNASEAADLYADVVDYGKELKAATKYGVKQYDDTKVDEAVADIEALIYGDLGGTLGSVDAYFIEVTGKATISAALGSLEAVNFTIDEFEAAIKDAQKKFYSDAPATTTPAVRVAYGADKTPDADLVYLKGTYCAVCSGTSWESIAQTAVADLAKAESYAEIDSILAEAASDLSELELLNDHTKVAEAKATYTAAWEKYVEEQKALMGSNYDAAAFTSVKADGDTLIGDATTVEGVKAAYADAQALIKTIVTKDALAAAKQAVIDSIAKLPLVSALTAADKDTVLSVYEAYKAYVETPGAAASDIINKAILKADLEKVLGLESTDLNKKLTDAKDALDKLSIVSDADCEKIAAMRNDLQALVDAGNDFNDSIDAIQDVAGLDTVTVTDANTATITQFETALAAEGKVWFAEVEVVNALAVKATKVNATQAEKQAALDAYNKLTDRQKYDVDANVIELIENLKMSDENAKAYVQDLSIKARSEKTSKGVKVTIKADVQELLDAGYTVEYRFYRSTKSNKNFGKPMIVKSTNTYTNTKGVKGTRYYYKAKLVVKNAAGEVVATTPLTQCLYATRVF